MTDATIPERSSRVAVHNVIIAVLVEMRYQWWMSAESLSPELDGTGLRRSYIERLLIRGKLYS